MVWHLRSFARRHVLHDAQGVSSLQEVQANFFVLICFLCSSQLQILILSAARQLGRHRLDSPTPYLKSKTGTAGACRIHFLQKTISRHFHPHLTPAIGSSFPRVCIEHRVTLSCAQSNICGLTRLPGARPSSGTFCLAEVRCDG